MIFPEGTFRRVHGLRLLPPGSVSRRRAGRRAHRARGVARHPARLQDDAAIFRRGTVELEILPAVAPDGDDWPAALRLRDRVRAAILERYGEPDLAAEGGSD